jgi:hypothetical protein
LLGDEGFGWLEDVPHDERRRFVVSRMFFDQVADQAVYTAADEELWGPLPEGSARRQLEELIAGLTMFSESDAAQDLPPEVAAVAARLQGMGSQVAAEEWLYLASNSWMAARSRKVLQHFKRAGAKVTEVTGDTAENLTWRAAGHQPGPPGTLTRKITQKAAFNVLFVGGVATAGVFVPWLTVPGAIIALFINSPSGPAQSSSAT